MDSPSKRARPHKQRPPLVSPANGENIWAWGSQLDADFSRVIYTRSAILGISGRARWLFKLEQRGPDAELTPAEISLKTGQAKRYGDNYRKDGR